MRLKIHDSGSYFYSNIYPFVETLGNKDGRIFRRDIRRGRMSTPGSRTEMLDDDANYRTGRRTLTLMPILAIA